MEIVALEADAQAELYFSWAVDLPFQRTPIGLFAEDEAREARIVHLVMVEHVREDGRKLHMESLRDHDVLLDAQVDVPVRKAAKGSGAAIVSRVYPQNRDTMAAPEPFAAFRTGTST